MSKKAKRKLKSEWRRVTGVDPSIKGMRRLKKAYVRRRPAFVLNPDIRIDVKRKSRGRITIELSSP